MSASTLTLAPADAAREQLERQIESHCNRALRRLDVLSREQDDVLLRAAREEVRRAAAGLGRVRELHEEVPS